MSSNTQWTVWLRIENFAILLVMLGIYYANDFSWWHFLILILVPDVSMLGYLGGKKIGAVMYNIGHCYIGPAIVAGYALLSDINTLIPLCIIWAAHIGADRALGYGLKSTEGFRHTHLGYVGRSKEQEG